MSLFKIRKKETTEIFKPPIIPTAILICVTVFGTIGYSYLWRNTDASFIDALYMTIITITTVGFKEVKDLDAAGRIFTMFVAIFGIGSLFFVLGSFMERLFIIEIENLRGKRKMNKIIDEIKDHIILVGFGRVGKLAAMELESQNIKFVVVDKIFETSGNEQFEKILKVQGDATDDKVLLKAGIERAKGIMVATANSATTVYVVLSAKVLNPNIYVVSRANDKFAFEKLQRAGADRVVSPYDAGAKMLANMISNPHLVDFFETSFGRSDTKVRIENIQLPDKSHFIGKSIKLLNIRQISGASIIAVIRDEVPTINPDGDFAFEKGDQLVALGSREQLIALEKM